jgi:hypothetical protein
MAIVPAPAHAQREGGNYMGGYFGTETLPRVYSPPPAFIRTEQACRIARDAR